MSADFVALPNERLSAAAEAGYKVRPLTDAETLERFRGGRRLTVSRASTACARLDRALETLCAGVGGESRRLPVWGGRQGAGLDDTLTFAPDRDPTAVLADAGLSRVLGSSCRIKLPQRRLDAPRANFLL